MLHTSVFVIDIRIFIRTLMMIGYISIAEKALIREAIQGAKEC